MADVANLSIKIESKDVDKAVKALDKLAASAEKAEKASDRIADSMKNYNNSTKSAVSEELKRQKSIDKMIEGLKQQEIRLREGKSGLDAYRASLLGASDAEKKQIAELHKKITAMQESNKTMKQSIEGLLGIAKISSVIFVVSKIGSAIKDLVSDVLNVTRTFQSLQISLNAAMGSIEKGAESYAFLRKESERLGLIFTDQVSGFSKIAAAAKGTSLEGDAVREIYLGISEASTVMQLSAEDTAGALKAVSDIMSKGTLQAEEIRGQLGDRLPGAFQLAAKAMGMTTEELNKQLKAGKVLSEDFIPKFARALREQYAGSVAEASQSIGANIARMENAFTDLKKAAYDAFSGDLNQLIKETTSFIVDFKDRIDDPDIQEDIKDITDGLRAMVTIGLQIGSLAIEFTRLIAPIQKINDVIAEGINPWKIYNKLIKEIAGDTGEALREEDKQTKAFLKKQGEQWDEWEKQTNDIIKARNKSKGIVDRDADAISKMIKSLQEENDQLALSKEAIIRKQAAQSGANKEDVETIITLFKKNEALEAAKDKEKELEEARNKSIEAEKQRQNSISNIINKLKEEIATYQQGKEVSAEYQLRQLNASESTIATAQALGAEIDALKAKTKAQDEYNKVMDKTSPDQVDLSRSKALEIVAKNFSLAQISAEQYAKALAQVNQFYDTKEMDAADKSLKEIGSELEKLTKFDGSSFGNTIADGINNAMISMQDLNDVFDNNKKAQAEIIKLQKQLATGKGSPEERAEATEKLGKAEENMLKNQLSGYRQLFGTTSQLFKENSKERTALHNLEMAFAAAEIAMNLQKTISNAYVAITNEGGGDPYTAFARVAAMATLMGGIVAAAGGSLSGGGSGGVTPTSSATSSSTVLGGGSEGSQSVSNSLSFMADIQAKQYNELRNINTGVADLNRNITGLVTSIVRTGDLNVSGVKEGSSTTTGSLSTRALSTLGYSFYADMINSLTSKIDAGTKNLLSALSPFTLGATNLLTETISNVATALVGGSKKTSILAQGLEISTGTVSDLLEGMGADIQKFADIKVKKEGGLFGSDKTYFKTLYEALGDDNVSQMFTNVFKSMGQTMVSISKGLGLGEDNLKQILEYSFDVGKLDLKGMDADAINKAVSEAISASGDKAVQALFGELIGQYQKVGEGLLETAIRVASEKAVVLDILEMTSQGFKDSNIPAIALATTQSLIELAGGLKELQDVSATYYDKFFSDAEKQVRLQGQLTESLASMGMPLPALREEFRKLVEAQQLNTEEGQRNYITLLSLAEGADQYYKVLEDSKKALEAETKAKEDAIAKSKQSLEIALLQTQGKTVEAVAIQRKIELETMDESLKPIQERIWALQDQAAAEEKSTASIKARSSELQNLIKTAISFQISALQEAANSANQNLTDATSALDAAFSAEISKVSSSFDSAIAGLNSSISSAESLSSEMRSIEESFRSAREAMVLAGTEQGVFIKAQKELFMAADLAKKGELTKTEAGKAIAAVGLSSGDTRSFYANSQDYKRDFLKQYAAISALENAAGSQAATQEAIANNFREELAITESIKNNAVAELEAQLATLKGTKGVEEKVMSVEDAIKNFQEAQNAADGANTLLKNQTVYLQSISDTLFGVESNTANLNSLISEYLSLNNMPQSFVDLSGVVSNTAPLVGSSTQTTTSNDDLKSEISALRADMAAANYAIAKNTQATAKVLSKWDYDGMPEVAV